MGDSDGCFVICPLSHAPAWCGERPSGTKIENEARSPNHVCTRATLDMKLIHTSMPFQPVWIVLALRADPSKSFCTGKVLAHMETCDKRSRCMKMFTRRFHVVRAPRQGPLTRRDCPAVVPTANID